MHNNGYRLPLACLVLCALIVWLVSSKAQDTATIKPAVRVELRLLADGTYQLGKTPLKPSELATSLKVLGGLPETPVIMLKPAEGVPYDQITKVLDVCREADLTTIGFVAPSPTPKVP